MGQIAVWPTGARVDEARQATVGQRHQHRKAGWQELRALCLHGVETSLFTAGQYSLVDPHQAPHAHM